MKKIFNWIWSSKQAKTIVHRPYRMVDEKARDYNEAHGLPLALILAVIAAGITGLTLGFKKRNEGGEG